MSKNPNVEKLRKAYQAWSDSKAASVDEWAKLMGEGGKLQSLAEQKPHAGIRSLAASRGMQATLDYLGDIKTNWEMQHYDLERIFADGDQVAAVVDCAWTNKATGKRFAGRMAHIWSFKAGQVVGFDEFLDTAELIGAATA